MPQILGQGALISVVLTAFDYTGGRLAGYKTDSQFVDEYERKEYLRNNRRRPLTETVADLGEGRGTVHEICLNRPRTNFLSCRNQAPRIRGAETGETEGEVRRRDQPCLCHSRVDDCWPWRLYSVHKNQWDFVSMLTWVRIPGTLRYQDGCIRRVAATPGL